MKIRLLLLCAAGVCGAFAGQIQLSDIVSPTTETYTGIGGLFPSTCGGVPCQTSLPLTINGNSYSTDNGSLRYFASNSGCPGGDSTCLNDFSDLGFIDIILGSAVPAVGGLVNPGNVEFDFFDAGNNLLGTVTVSSANGFGGWADPGGIKEVKVIDHNSDQSSFFFDSLTTGSVRQQTPPSGTPEPGSVVLIGAGMLMVGVARRKRL